MPGTVQAGRIVVALPAYNEDANLGALLKNIHDTLAEASLDHLIVVVDDGSRDRTPEVLRQSSECLPLVVETHAVNQGLGGALRDALKRASAAASARGIIVTMDADESHTPALIPLMVEKILEGSDVVIASRYCPGGGVQGLSPTRVWISRFASWILRVFYPIPGVRDFTCGFRAYRAEALQMAYAKYGDGLVDQPGFQCMVDMLLKLRRLPLSFGEVPMQLRYDLKKGGSKMRLMATSLATLRLLWKRRFEP